MHASTSDRKRGLSLARCACSCALLVAFASSASAQDDEPGISARDRQAAAEAYDRGTSALAPRLARAGQWFETAHRLAPAAAAFVEAARSYERAENELKAASIGLQLQALYPDDRTASRMADRVLRTARRFVRVDVTCEGCAVSVDGALVNHTSFFVEPDADHVVEAEFETGTQRETVRGAAGEQRAVSFTAPPAPVVAEPEPEPEPEGPEQPVTAPPSNDLAVVPWPATIIGAALTVAAGAVLIWSGVDTLDGVPAYEADPTPERLADGQSRELRTNVLIAVTGGLALTTLVLAFFTDWGGGQPPVETALVIQPDGAYAGLRGRL
jgi:hypothetical protein